jgi:hypothetical protein
VYSGPGGANGFGANSDLAAVFGDMLTASVTGSGVVDIVP